MDGFFFARIDYDDRNTRLDQITMEMVWESSGSLGVNGDIFTGVLYQSYGPPPGFCFDVRCDDAIPVQVCVPDSYIRQLIMMQYFCTDVYCTALQEW